MKILSKTIALVILVLFCCSAFVLEAQANLKTRKVTEKEYAKWYDANPYLIGKNTMQCFTLKNAELMWNDGMSHNWRSVNYRLADGQCSIIPFWRRVSVEKTFADGKIALVTIGHIEEVDCKSVKKKCHRVDQSYCAGEQDMNKPCIDCDYDDICKKDYILSETYVFGNQIQTWEEMSRNLIPINKSSKKQK